MNKKPTHLNASQLLYLLNDDFNTYNKKRCEAIVLNVTGDINAKNPTGLISKLENHTGASLQFAVDEIWNNFKNRKQAMKNIHEYPIHKLYNKDKIPKTIYFPRVLKSLLSSDVVGEIVKGWKEEYSGFGVEFKV